MSAVISHGVEFAAHVDGLGGRFQVGAQQCGCEGGVVVQTHRVQLCSELIEVLVEASPHSAFLVVARLREEAREGNGPRQAAALSLRHTGPTVAAAGVILAGTFASMMLAGNSVLAQMRFAISAGMAIAAFVMAMFFTPAVTALIGHGAWWPGHGDTRRKSQQSNYREPVRMS